MLILSIKSYPITLNGCAFTCVTNIYNTFMFYNPKWLISKYIRFHRFCKSFKCHQCCIIPASQSFGKHYCNVHSELHFFPMKLTTVIIDYTMFRRIWEQSLLSGDGSMVSYGAVWERYNVVFLPHVNNIRISGLIRTRDNDIFINVC